MPVIAQRPLRTVARIAAAAALIAAAAWAAHAVSLQRGLRQLQDAAQQRLEIEAARLDAGLARFELLPSLLETSPDVLKLLDAPADAVLSASVSRQLQALNAVAGAANLYVLNAAGLTLAASDFDQPGTPLGQDLSYRPYVRDALAHGRGRFYGVGVTSRKAGFYLAFALPAHGAPRGVATVKVDLEAGEAAWRDAPGDLLVLDEHGVVVLSSQARWKYRPLAPLAAGAQAEAARSRRYGEAALAPLAWQAGDRLGERALRVKVDGRAYLATERAANLERWRLIQLDDEAPVREDARAAAVSAGLAAAVLLLAATLWRQRRRALRQQLESRAALQAAHDSLERMVDERTAELRAAQDELVHAGKLAMLGQMSAAMTHEFNQPLAALRTLSDNAALLIERERFDEARANLARMGRLVSRLGLLTNQLKVFARKNGDPLLPVPVAHAVAETLALLADRLRDSGVAVEVTIEPGALAVLAEPARLEQVLVNIVGNAVDALGAVAAGSERRIAIHASAAGGRATIAVHNSGPPIAADILPHLFEPFVTSKPAGKGLGLGLMISAHIVGAFGGEISARNPAAGGAEFRIELPCPPPP